MGVKQNGNSQKKPRWGLMTKSSVWELLVEYDQHYTYCCGICASGDATWAWLRPLMKVLEISGHGVPWFGILLTVLYLSYSARDSDRFNLMANFIMGMLLDLLVNVIMKGLIRRPRPVLNKADMIMNISVDAFSFPSGHCTRMAFVLYCSLTSMMLPLYQQLLIFIWTFAVCVSRVLLGRHYWSDVICGMLIGLIQGIVIERHWKTWDLNEP